jgi:YD repeat-containing protein
LNPSYAGPELLTYDQTGKVIHHRKPDTCELEQDYDAMGRLVAQRTINSAGSCANSPIDEQFGYDARGLLVAAQNPDVGLIREYDALGRMLREIDTRFGTGVGYAYDKASRLTSKVYPDGSSVHYAYDGAGRTVGISDPFGETTRFVYDAAGRRVEKLGSQGLYLCIFDGDEDVDGVDVGAYSDYNALRDVVVRQLEAGKPGSKFPTLINHSDCDGEWSVADCEKLQVEPAEIATTLKARPPFRFLSEWQTALARSIGLSPRNAFESFIDVDGEFLLERLQNLVQSALDRRLPILFQ